MSSVPAEPAVTDSAAAAAKPAAGKLVRSEGGRCGNCGFGDSGYYCSRCGEPLHGTRDTVLQILWADLVEGPVHSGFALIKTTWLMLTRPRRFFDAVLRRQHGMTHVRFFLTPVWRRVSPRPHGVPNAVKYFVLIYTLTFLGGWIVGVNVSPRIPLPFSSSSAKLPTAITDPLFILFVVSAAWMYSKAMSMMLGGKIPTELLTRFMLYLNGLALIPFVGMSVTGTRHPVGFFIALGFWLYVLFALPQIALPRIFGVPRTRLGMAQGGAAVANFALVVVLVFCAGIAADLLVPNWNNPRAAVSVAPLEAAQSGFSAVERAARSNPFPFDTVTTLMHLPAPTLPRATQAVRRTAHGHARPRTER